MVFPSTFTYVLLVDVVEVDLALTGEDACVVVEPLAVFPVWSDVLGVEVGLLVCVGDGLIVAETNETARNPPMIHKSILLTLFTVLNHQLFRELLPDPLNPSPYRIQYQQISK